MQIKEQSLWQFIIGKQRRKRFKSMLNEQAIQNMFGDDSVMSHCEHPKDEVSLNFTVTNRSNKNIKLPPDDHFTDQYKPEQFISVASNGLNYFNSFLMEFSSKADKTIDNINELIHKAQQTELTTISLNDFQTIRNQIFRKDNQNENYRHYCKSCLKSKKALDQYTQKCANLEQQCTSKDATINQLQKSIQQLNLQIIKERILSGVQTNMLNDKIKGLNVDISNIKFEKQNLQRTYLFNKTKNSDNPLKMQLQKSKGLSAAKNSTYSSDFMARGNESIIFIDPLESDIDQWVKFFQNQKERYEYLCKKEEKQHKIKIGRSLTRAEKDQIHKNGVFLIYQLLKTINQNLKNIRELTSSFNLNSHGGNTNTNKSPLKERIQNQNHNDSIPSQLQSQMEKMKRQINKLTKVNEGLTKSKNDLQQSNKRMKEDLIHYNFTKNQLQKTIQEKTTQIQLLSKRITDIQHELNHMRIQAEEKVKYQQLVQELSLQNARLHEQTQYVKQLKQCQAKLRMLQKSHQEMSSKKRQLQIQIKTLEFKLKKEKAQRKRIHNQLQDIKGSIRVFCRVRPRLKSQHPSEALVIKALDDERLLLVQTGKTIRFDAVFADNHNSQEEVFEDTRKLIQSAFDGYNLCVFAYGQTGSGKTYTIHGTKSNEGIAPRAFQQIFRLIQEEKQQTAITLQINMVQLYNDKIYDLINPQSPKNTKQIEIKEDKDGNIYLQNIMNVKVSKLDALNQMYVDGILNRKIRSTNKNQSSSRSHLILTIILEFRNIKSQERYSSKISFVDLAGAEKSNSSTSHEGLKETTCINKSLTALTNVISAIYNKQEHIPYRDNKLTMILKDSLNDKGKMLMFVNVAPTDTNRDQTMSALGFANKIKSIERSSKTTHITKEAREKEGKQGKQGKERQHKERQTKDKQAKDKQLRDRQLREREVVPRSIVDVVKPKRSISRLSNN